MRKRTIRSAGVLAGRAAGVSPALCRRDGGGPAAGTAARRTRMALLLLLVVAFAACSRKEQKYQTMVQTGGGNAQKGRQLIDQYGCTACHSIPGIAGPKGMVGPSLEHIATRTYIAGKFPNKPDVLIHWLQDPQGMDPSNAMPNLGISPNDARDIAAYLYTLR